MFHWATASERILGAGKWGAGPTAVVLKQTGAFTYGLLANQIRLSRSGFIRLHKIVRPFLVQ